MKTSRPHVHPVWRLIPDTFWTAYLFVVRILRGGRP